LGATVPNPDGVSISNQVIFLPIKAVLRRGPGDLAGHQDLKRWDEYRQLVAQRKKGLISQQEFEEKKRIPVTELISDERG
jgi:hypothetical protein